MRENGVSLVALLDVVQRDHRTKGSCSIQFFPQVSSLSKVLALRPRSTSALARSTCPLLRGCATEAKQTLMPISSQYERNAPLVNCVPLSMMMRFGTPKRHTRPLMNLTAACAVIVRTGSTSGHLVNLSMATNKNL